MTSSQNLCVVGLGFVGLPVAGTFAELGYTVTGVDAAEHVLQSLQQGKAHFAEEGIQDMLDRVLGKSLSIADTIEKDKHDIYIIAVGTPVDAQTHKPEMTYVESASSAIGKALKSGDLVIMRSTVPVGTTRKVVLPILEKESGLTAGDDFDLVFAPERLVAGKALTELRELPQIIGGLSEGSDLSRATEFFEKLTPKIVPVENLEAAEMGKLIDNSYRDFHFAYANQMARMCEQIGIDATTLIKAVNKDYKRNRIPVPSPGVGGICLMKDPYLLMAVGEEYGYIPELTKVARQVNEEMPHHVGDRVLELLKNAGKDPKESTVFILGFAFKGKPETSDTRNAPTAGVIETLSKAGCTILGHDPVVPQDVMENMNATTTSIEDGFKAADAAIIMTNHADYEVLDIQSLISTMKKPAVLFGGWQMFDTKMLHAIPDLHYAGVGNIGTKI